MSEVNLLFPEYDDDVLKHESIIHKIRKKLKRSSKVYRETEGIVNKPVPIWVPDDYAEEQIAIAVNER